MFVLLVDCSKDSCYRKSNISGDKGGTNVKDQIISTIKNEESHPESDDSSSKYGASNLGTSISPTVCSENNQTTNEKRIQIQRTMFSFRLLSLVGLKQSKSLEEDDNKMPNSTSTELSSSQQTKPINRKVS